MLRLRPLWPVKGLLSFSLMGFALLLPLCGFAPVAAANDTVTLFRTGARMERTVPCAVEEGSVRFALPPGTDLQSLDVRIAGRTVRTITSQLVQAPENAAVLELRAQLRKACAEAAIAQGEVEANKARITFWKKPKTMIALSAELEKTDTLMQEKLTALYSRRSALDDHYAKAKEAVSLLEKKLKAMGDAKAREEHVVVDVSPTTPGQVQVSLGYFLSDCGWTPSYTLDALTEKGVIQLQQFAELHQSTGSNWTDCTLILSSGLPRQSVLPPRLKPWRIEPVHNEPRPMAMDAMVSAPAQLKMNVRSAEDATIVPREEATSTTWNLGVRSIEAGVPTRLELNATAWKADFVRVLRPSKSAEAFLMAEVNLPEALSLSKSMARFMVNGITVGSAPFSFDGVSEKLFFGVDPHVTAKMKLDTRQSGEKGFIDKQQTRNWRWTMDLTNAHSTPVAIRVEDPTPQSGDTAITLASTSTPKPEILDHTYVWKLTLPAGGKKEITHAVTASAPADMHLEESR